MSSRGESKRPSTSRATSSYIHLRQQFRPKRNKPIAGLYLFSSLFCFSKVCAFFYSKMYVFFPYFSFYAFLLFAWLFLCVICSSKSPTMVCYRKTTPEISYFYARNIYMYQAEYNASTKDARAYKNASLVSIACHRSLPVVFRSTRNVPAANPGVVAGVCRRGVRAGRHVQPSHVQPQRQRQHSCSSGRSEKERMGENRRRRSFVSFKESRRRSPTWFFIISGRRLGVRGSDAANPYVKERVAIARCVDSNNVWHLADKRGSSLPGLGSMGRGNEPTKTRSHNV